MGHAYCDESLFTKSEGATLPTRVRFPKRARARSGKWVAGSPLFPRALRAHRKTAGMRNPPRPPSGSVSDCRIPATHYMKYAFLFTANA